MAFPSHASWAFSHNFSAIPIIFLQFPYQLETENLAICEIGKIKQPLSYSNALQVCPALRRQTSNNIGESISSLQCVPNLVLYRLVEFFAHANSVAITCAREFSCSYFKEEPIFGLITDGRRLMGACMAPNGNKGCAQFTSCEILANENGEVDSNSEAFQICQYFLLMSQVPTFYRPDFSLQICIQATILSIFNQKGLRSFFSWRHVWVMSNAVVEIFALKCKQKISAFPKKSGTKQNLSLILYL